MKEKKYLFLHLPKTAGSMFRTILIDNFGYDAVLDNPLMSELVYSSDQIRKILYLYPYRFYMGHVYRLKPALDISSENLSLITFVRDPVDKVFSAYSYLKGRDMTNPNHPTKTKSFIEMVEQYGFDVNSTSFDLDSSQLDWLCGDPNEGIELVHKAVDEGRLHIFPTEKFDDALICLEKIFKDDFKDCSYAKRINESKRFAHDESDKKLAESLPWIPKDRDLHAYSYQYLDKVIKKIFPNDGELEAARSDFRKRCEVKKVNFETDSFPMPLMRRIRTAGRILLKGK